MSPSAGGAAVAESLWGLPDAALVVVERSGALYTNQVMGHACVQAEAEGILVPLSPDYPVDARGRPTVDTLAERLGRAVHLARCASGTARPTRSTPSWRRSRRPAPFASIR